MRIYEVSNRTDVDQCKTIVLVQSFVMVSSTSNMFEMLQVVIFQFFKIICMEFQKCFYQSIKSSMINCAVPKIEAWSFWCEKKFFLNLSIDWSSANDILLSCTFWINLEQTLLRCKFFKVIPNFFYPWTLRVQNWRLKNCSFDVAVLLCLVMNRSFLAVGGNGRCFQRFKGRRLK